MDGNRIECLVTIGGEYVGRALYQGASLLFHPNGHVHPDGSVVPGEPSEADEATETIDLESALIEEFDCLIQG